jgi:hypothetical protein
LLRVLEGFGGDPEDGVVLVRSGLGEADALRQQRRVA